MIKLLILMAIFAFAIPALAGSKPELKLPVFPQSKPPAKQLYHLDLMQSPLDVRFAMTVLQGLVNREEPRLYVSQNPEWHGAGNFPLWIEDMKKRGHSFEEITSEEALSRFGHCAKGAVLYDTNPEQDQNSLHKLNALTLYCALENVLPVTPELNEKLKLPVVLDVRGKYDEAGEAYGWAYRELWPRANRKLIAHTNPEHMVLRDYLVQHRIMPFWISKGMTAEVDYIAQGFVRDADPNAVMMGCWGGYGERPPGRYDEPQLQRIASLYGKFVVVTDGCFNTSVFSGLKYRKPEKRAVAPAELDRGKVYVVFHITDGDNLQWLQQDFINPRWWNDPMRGEVPISWSISPNAAELIPNFLEYIDATKTANDEFTCPTGGIGLVAPALYGRDSERPSEKVYSAYLKATNKSMRRVGQEAIHLGDTSLVPWTRADFDRFAREVPAVKIILGDYGRMLAVYPENSVYTVSGGVPVVRTTTTGVDGSKDNDECARKIAETVRANTPKERPGFMHVCLVNWFVTPTAIHRAAEMLGAEYVPVLPSQMAELMQGTVQSK